MTGALAKVAQLRGVTYNWVRGARSSNSNSTSHAATHAATDGRPTDAAAGAAGEESGLSGDTNALYDGRRHVGLLAQDVLRALPEAVTSMASPWRRSVPDSGAGAAGAPGAPGGPGGRGEETYLGVSYADLVPLLLEAVKELDQRTHDVHAGADGLALAEEGYEDEEEDEEEGYAEEDGYADDDVVWGRANTTTATTAATTNTTTATAASAVPGPAVCDRDRLMAAVASLTAMLDRAGMSLSSRSLSLCVCVATTNTHPPDPVSRVSLLPPRCAQRRSSVGCWRSLLEASKHM